ncbi:MAG: hypothetical protein AB1646_21805 [Thermodesulfobacteriota bacterium]
MARGHQPTEDLDELIDRAVDTFFVEESELHPSGRGEAVEPERPATPKAASPKDRKGEGVSLDSALDDLFSTPPDELDSEGGPVKSVTTPTSLISSGDAETDKAIDFAVDTLFVEVPETAIPETTELDVSDVIEAEEAPLVVEGEGPTIDLDLADEIRLEPDASWAEASPMDAAAGASETTVAYDDLMAREIERHFESAFVEPEAPVEPAVPRRKAAVAPQPPAVEAPRPAAAAPVQAQALRKLQEAILTLEWEISKRSVASVMKELKSIRSQFQDDVTVDFAALSMRLVVDYLIKRTHQAHPESIRFLLDVTDLLDRSVSTPNLDPLAAFHRILSRYEKYKSTVRKAEGLPDRQPAILGELEIKDPEIFAEIVKAHAQTILKAGYSLAKRIHNTTDSANLIRSFRFLVTRSINRILDGTLKSKGAKPIKKGNKRRT